MILLVFAITIGTYNESDIHNIVWVIQNFRVRFTFDILEIYFKRSLFLKILLISYQSTQQNNENE